MLQRCGFCETRACNSDGGGALPWRLSSTLLSMFPPFVPVESNNSLCREHSLTYLEALQHTQLWALKMYDSSAKLPSGLLNGNVNQLGDFDQCLEVEEGGVRGQYCLAFIEITLQSASVSSPLATVYNLTHSHHAFRSKLEDPGHRVPRFSTVNWAVCVPSSCSAADVQHALAASVDRYVSSPALLLRVHVDSEMCQVRRDSGVPPASLFAIGVFVSVAIVIAVATIADYLVLAKTHLDLWLELLLAFSLKTNYSKLTDVSQSAGDIHSVHGIRALNAVMLFLAHKSMAMFFNPYVNRTSMTEMLGKPWTTICRAASLYTDPFIMISGLLTTHSLLRRLSRHRTINVPQEYISRLLRIVPTLGALILFCTFVLPILGSGPQWNLVVRYHAEVCKTNWWMNLLFIHNYFGFQNMCLTHTHHIGIDTQLFVLSPLLVWGLWRWPRYSFTVLFLLAASSTVLRFYTTYARQLSLYVYFGNSVSQMFETADYSYILPSHRFTVYAIGMALGYSLWHFGNNFKLNNNQLTLGWTVAIGMLYHSTVTPSKMGDLEYVYDRLDAANYAAFSPITWCLFFAWIIFTSQTGNGGLLAKILSWPYFQVFTRIAYSFYLTQFPVFFYNVGHTRTALHYTVLQMLNIKEIIVILLASAVLTLAVEMPFMNIRTALLKRPQVTDKQKPE